MGLVLLGGIIAALAATAALLLRRVNRLRLWPAVLLVVSAPMEAYRTDVGVFNLSVFRLSLAVALVALVVDVLRRPPPRLPLPPSFVAYAVLISLQAISVLAVTTAPTLGYRYVSQYVAGLAAAVVICRFVRRDDLRTLAVALLCAGFLPTLAAVVRTSLINAGHGGTLPGLTLLPVDPDIEAARQSGSYLLDGTTRMLGTFNDPNTFAFFMALVLFAGLGLLSAELMRAQDARAAVTVMLGLAVATSAVVILGSYSRSAWLFCVVGSVTFAALLGRETWRHLYSPRRAAAVIVITLMVGAAAGPLVVSRLDPENRGARLSSQTHADTMRLALELTGERPLLGVGLGAYGSYAGQPALVSSSHSTVLTAGAELGIPGMLALLAAMVLTGTFAATASRNRAGGERGLVAAFAAAFVGLVAANVLYEVWADDFQWVFFGLVVVAGCQPTVLALPGLVPQRPAASMPACEEAVSTDVAAVIVHYKTPAALSSSLGSLRDQSTPPVEITVVDTGACEDGIAEPPLAEDGWRWHRAEANLGFGAACNRGASLTGAPFLLVLNADLHLAPGALALLRHHLATTAGTAMVAPRIIGSDGSVERNARARPGLRTGILGRTSALTRLLARIGRLPRELDPDIKRNGQVDWVSGACMLIRRDAFEAAGGFDERYWMYWEDADLCLRLAALGYMIGLEPRAVAHHATGSSGRSERTIRAFHESAALFTARHVARTRGGALLASAALRARMSLVIRRHTRDQRRRA